MAPPGILVGGYAPAPAAPSSPLEPTGSWFGTVDNEVVFSRDGKNWSRADYIASTFWDSSYRWEEGDGTMALLAVDIVADSFKMNNQSIPDFTQNSGGDGIGQCQWIAHGPSGWVARTTTQLRISADAITWTDPGAPADWITAGSGQFKYMSTAGLYFSLGSTFSSDADGYWTSANRTAWTKRTFPVNWTANGQGGNVDWLVEDVAPGVQSGGTIMLVGLQTSGDIYSSTDGINWTLRLNGPATLTGLAWNEAEGAFYATFFAANPQNLYRSTDGITWNTVNPNNLDSFVSSGQIACDPVKNLMWVNPTASSSGFNTSDSAVSTDGGTTWEARWAIGGRWWGHVNFKVGPVINDALRIDPDPIIIFDGAPSPGRAFCRFTARRDNTLDQQTFSGGISQIGWWTDENAAGGEDYLSPYGREIRVDQNSGSALNFGNPGLGVWLPMSADRFWGYDVNPGPGVLTGNFTVRFRDRITLVESAPVTLTLTAEST